MSPWPLRQGDRVIQIVVLLLALAMTSLWLYDMAAIFRAVRGWIGF